MEAKEVLEAINQLEDGISECDLILQDDPTCQEALQVKESLQTEIEEARGILKELEEAKTEKADGVVSSVEKLQGRGGRQGNKKIHPRSKYAHEEPDFAVLRTKFPSLSKFMRDRKDGRCIMDFSDPAATLELTRCLLKEDFGLKWDIPLGMLDLYWITRSLGCHEGNVRGLDIGCGANCIYPLLGATALGWEFIGVDVTGEAVEWASRNASMNDSIAHLISIRKLPEDAQEILIPAVQPDEVFHFCMCNPPFFSTIEESAQNPHTAYGGTQKEMVYQGGDLAFVLQMVEDSSKLQGSIHWYTALLGKKSSLKEIRNKLYSVGAQAIRTTELCQGKTSRWSVAWSFVAKGTDNKPLKRSTMDPVEAIPIAIRDLSYEIKSNKKSATNLLDMLERILNAQEAQCLKDESGSEMKVNVQVESAHLDTSSKKRRLRQLDEKQVDSSQLMCKRPLEIRVRVSQNCPGRFNVLASIARESSTADARAFSKLMNIVWGDLTMMWD